MGRIISGALAILMVMASLYAEGTSISLAIEVSKSRVFTYEPFYVKVCLTNVSNKEFRFNRPGGVSWGSGYWLYSSKEEAAYTKFTGGVPVQDEFRPRGYYFRSSVPASEKNCVVDMVYFRNAGNYKIKAGIEDKWAGIGEAVYESAPERVEVIELPPDEPVLDIIPRAEIEKLSSKITWRHYYSGRRLGAGPSLKKFSEDMATSMTQLAKKSVFYETFMYSEALFKTADRKRISDAALQAIEVYIEREAHPWVKAQLYGNVSENLIGRGFREKAIDYARKGQSYEESFPLYYNIGLTEKVGELESP